MSIVNEWLLWNLMLLAMFLFYYFLGKFFERRGGPKTLPDSTMIVMGLFTFIVANMFGAVAYVGAK